MQLFPIFAEAEKIEQKVVYSMRSRNCIQANDTGVRLLNPIGLLLAFPVTLGFDCKEAGIDKLVAPKASDPGPDRPICTHNVDQAAIFRTTTNLRAQLGAGYQILMDECVEHKARPH